MPDLPPRAQLGAATTLNMTLTPPALAGVDDAVQAAPAILAFFAFGVLPAQLLLEPLKPRSLIEEMTRSRSLKAWAWTP